MKTYMLATLNKESILAVLKTVQVIAKNTDREVLQGFHIEMAGDHTVLYATDGFRLLKWETESYILISEGTEENPGSRIQSGTYRIINMDTKNGFVILEDIEGNYPDCNAIIEGSKKEEVKPVHVIGMNTKLLYDMTKNFNSQVYISWTNNIGAYRIEPWGDEWEGLTLIIMPLTVRNYEV